LNFPRARLLAIQIRPPGNSLILDRVRAACVRRLSGDLKKGASRQGQSVIKNSISRRYAGSNDGARISFFSRVPSDRSDKLRQLRASVFYRADVRRLPVAAPRDHKDRGSTFGLYCRHAMRA